MKTFTCSGFNRVQSESIGSAAEIFANRAARRSYGKSAYARTCSMGSYYEDGTLAEFSSFVGYSSGQNETTGHNVNFTVQLSK